MRAGPVSYTVPLTKGGRRGLFAGLAYKINIEKLAVEINADQT